MAHSPAAGWRERCDAAWCWCRSRVGRTVFSTGEAWTIQEVEPGTYVYSSPAGLSRAQALRFLSDGESPETTTMLTCNLCGAQLLHEAAVGRGFCGPCDGPPVPTSPPPRAIVTLRLRGRDVRCLPFSRYYGPNPDQVVLGYRAQLGDRLGDFAPTPEEALRRIS